VFVIWIKTFHQTTAKSIQFRSTRNIFDSLILGSHFFLVFIPVPPEGRLEENRIIWNLRFHLFPSFGSAIPSGNITRGTIALFTLVDAAHCAVPDLEEEPSVHRFIFCRQRMMDVVMVRRVEPRLTVDRNEIKIDTSMNHRAIEIEKEDELQKEHLEVDWQ